MIGTLCILYNDRFVNKIYLICFAGPAFHSALLLYCLCERPESER